MRNRARGWFVAAIVLITIGSVAAFVGDKMFRLRSQGADGSQEVVAMAGNWAALGFGGGFVIICALPILLCALVLWWRDKR